MRTDPYAVTRRRWLQTSVATGLLLPTGALLAETLSETPRMTEGPFYPDKLPLDTDNDLIIINETITPAVGEITHLTGRVLTTAGSPVRNAFVEIWQVDHQGVYLHSADKRIRDQRDVNFQGYGRFLTDSTGAYYFRTVKPVPYPGRTPHIHVAVSSNGRRVSTTQLFIKGHPQNERDFIFRALRNDETKQLVLVDFVPVPDSKIGELTARFDVVLGTTPSETDDGSLQGGIGKPEGTRFPPRRPG